MILEKSFQSVFLTSHTNYFSIADNSNTFSRGNIIESILHDLRICHLSNLDKLWIQGQIRWIIWTLSSHERRVPIKFLGNLLNYNNIFEITKYRYAQYSNNTELLKPTKFESSRSIQVPKKRFVNRASMSPLQRCSDIHTLIWPLLLCIAISIENEEGKDEENKLTIEVTDGWWWTRVQLDFQLQQLVTKVI
jgi:hypothetical protein